MERIYKTVAGEGQDEFIEQRSRFIGYVRPVKTEEEALDFIREKKKLHWDAKHNIYAYVLQNGGLRRCSDDGEPQGTAGVPALDVLLKSGVTDVVVVVTRYFGGILLGAGGLVRAYTKGARIALDAGKIITMEMCSKCRICCDYNQYGRLSALIPEQGGVIDDSGFGEAVTLDFHIPSDKLAAFEKKLADSTCGRIGAEIIGEDFFKMS